MSVPDFHSVRRHFVYDAGRSGVIQGTHFFMYLHCFQFSENEEKENKYYDERIFLIVEPYEITLKQEVLVYANENQEELLSTQLKNLLVVPLDTAHNDFAEIETVLIRHKQADIKETRQKKKQGKSSFEQVLQDFVEDLYIHKYFKECGDVQKLKSALEHIPLLQGIIRKFLFDYYYKDSTTLRKKDIRTTYKREHFEDAYLNYGRFLSQPQNEKLFIKGGWFVQRDDEAKGDIDHELERIQRNYIEVSERLESSRLLFLEQANTRHILKRYGIIDVLRLVLPKKLADIFVYALAIVVFFILADILVFNLPIESKTEHPLLIELVEYGLKVACVFFLIYTLGIGVFLLKKYHFRIIPGIFLPRLAIAIMSGWLVFTTAEELLKIDMDINEWLLAVMTVAIFITTLAFMIFEINNYAPAMITQKVIKRSLVVTGLAFVVSYTFGFWVMSHINEKYMSIDNFMVRESKFVEEFEDRKIFYKDILKELRDKQKELSDKIGELNKSLTNEGFDAIRGSKKYRTWNLKTLDPIKTENQPLNTVYLGSTKDIMDIDSVFKDSVNALNIKITYYNTVIDSIQQKRKNRKTDTVKTVIFSLSLTAGEILSGKVFNYDSSSLQRDYDTLQKRLNGLQSAYPYFIKYLEKTPAEIKETKVYAKQYKMLGREKTTFPNMLLTRALLAMFIGIFLQLIIQDKTITEPI